MTKPRVEVPVELTEEEVGRIEAQARSEGVPRAKRLTFAMRQGAFGWDYASRMLTEDDPTPSQNGPQKGGDDA